MSVASVGGILRGREYRRIDRSLDTHDALTKDESSGNVAHPALCLSVSHSLSHTLSLSLCLCCGVQG